MNLKCPFDIELPRSLFITKLNTEKKLEKCLTFEDTDIGWQSSIFLCAKTFLWSEKIWCEFNSNITNQICLHYTKTALKYFYFDWFDFDLPIARIVNWIDRKKLGFMEIEWRSFDWIDCELKAIIQVYSITKLTWHCRSRRYLHFIVLSIFIRFKC